MLETGYLRKAQQGTAPGSLRGPVICSDLPEMLPLCPSNVARRCRATQVRGTGARACPSPPSAPLPTTHPTHKPPRRRFRRGLRVGRRSGSPAPRSRPSSAENGPMPGGFRSRGRGTSPAGSKRKRSSSLPSPAARARCLKRSTSETLPTPPGGRNRGRRVLSCSLPSPPAPTPRPYGACATRTQWPMNGPSRLVRQV